jgi:hypothetical protein
MLHSSPEVHVWAIALNIVGCFRAQARVCANPKTDECQSGEVVLQQARW